MMVTDEEAREKACPFSHGSSLGVQPCAGTACMGWRWVGWRDANNGSFWTGSTPRADDERVGTCGFKPPRADA